MAAIGSRGSDWRAPVIRKGSLHGTDALIEADDWINCKIPIYRVVLGIFFLERLGRFADRQMAERVGFEPTLLCSKPDFESGAFDHSATFPREAELYMAYLPFVGKIFTVSGVLR